MLPLALIFLGYTNTCIKAPCNSSIDFSMNIIPTSRVTVKEVGPFIIASTEHLHSEFPNEIEIIYNKNKLALVCKVINADNSTNTYYDCRAWVLANVFGHGLENCLGCIKAPSRGRTLN